MFIHRRKDDIEWQIRELETSSRGDYTNLGPDIGLLTPDLDAEGNWAGKRNWRMKERTRKGARRFGTTVRDNWIPGIAGAGGGAAAGWGVSEVFNFLPEVHWIIPTMLGGFVGWKGGEWTSQGTAKAISLIGRPFRAFNERYYFKL